MRLIIINAKGYDTHTLELNKTWLAGLAALLVTVPIMLGVSAYLLATLFSDTVVDSSVAAKWEQQLTEQKEQLELVNTKAEVHLNALTARLGALQAQLLRVDALGERLVDIAGIDSDEFDFNLVPAVGGPEPNDVDLSVAYQPPRSPLFFRVGESTHGEDPPPETDQADGLGRAIRLLRTHGGLTGWTDDQILDLPYARFRQEVRLAVEAYEAEEKARTRAAFVSGWHALAAMGGRKAPKLSDYLASAGLIERQRGVKTGRVRTTPADRERARRNAERVREAFRRRPAE